MTEALPTLFLSHGSPMLGIEPGETGASWHALAQSLPRPRSVLCVSAHWTTVSPAVGAAEAPETIHDFYGFPEPLYRLRYEVPGAPALAESVTRLLAAAQLPHAVDPARGLDHGAWVPLMFMYPKADIPVTQLSVQPQRDAAWHYRLGAALAPLRSEGVLVLASGGAVHNLGEVRRGGGATPAWAREFDAWLAGALAAGRHEDLLQWERQAPAPLRAHPSPEHLLPLHVALGAAGPAARGERIHDGFTLASLSMAAFRFA